MVQVSPKYFPPLEPQEIFEPVSFAVCLTLKVFSYISGNLLISQLTSQITLLLYSSEARITKLCVSSH